MPISNELLRILCCPKSKKALRVLSTAEIETINKSIAKQQLSYTDGSIVNQPLSEGLITTDNETVYRIDEDIPVMLIEKGIPLPPTFGL